MINITPAVIEDIAAVMETRKDFVEIAHTLRRIICVKGWGFKILMGSASIEMGVSKAKDMSRVKAVISPGYFRPTCC